MRRTTYFVARVRGLVSTMSGRVSGGRGLRIGRNVELGRGLRTGAGVFVGAGCDVSGDVSLGDGVFVHPHVILRAFDGSICIGEGTTVNPFTRVYGKGGVTIGKMVSIAPGVTIVAAEKNVGERDVPIKRQGVKARGIAIGDDVWLAANAVVLDGVTVGQGAVVGAGAVVTRDVEPYAIVAGVPARVIGRRGEPLEAGTEAAVGD